jgi:hypothetical protein
MASAIDATKPEAGSPTTASVRSNFASAESEINALQTQGTTDASDISDNADAITALQSTAVVACGTFSSDGVEGGTQDISNCIGVASIVLHPSNELFTVTLSSAVASSSSMIITLGLEWAQDPIIAKYLQVSTTVFYIYVQVGLNEWTVRPGIAPSFAVIDAG